MSDQKLRFFSDVILINNGSMIQSKVQKIISLYNLVQKSMNIVVFTYLLMMSQISKFEGKKLKLFQKTK